MKTFRCGGLAICLLVAGVSTGMCDETPPVRWRATFVPGEAAEDATAVREPELPIDPGLSQPVSTGRLVDTVKSSSDDRGESDGILSRCGRLFAAIMDVFSGILHWVIRQPKGPLGLVLLVIFLMNWFAKKSMP